MIGNQAYFLGRAARREGKSASAMPFPPASPQDGEWRRGWLDVDCGIVGEVPTRTATVAPVEEKQAAIESDWTDDERRRLQELWNTTTLNAEAIGVLFGGRTYWKVQDEVSRLRKAGWQFKDRRGLAWRQANGKIAIPERDKVRSFTPQEDARILAMADKKIPDWSIAEKLKTYPYRVRDRLTKLRAMRAAGTYGSRSGMFWTEAEKEEAWRLALEERLSNGAIGLKMGRSVPAVSDMLERMRKQRGIAPREFSHMRNPSTWTETQDAQLIRLWNVEKKDEIEIGEILGLSKAAVANRKKKLRQKGIRLETRRGWHGKHRLTPAKERQGNQIQAKAA
jgi:hypothetical protein